MTPPKAERNHEMLMERVCGTSLEQIGQRHGITRQMAHRVVVREAQKHVDQVELQLMVAAKQDQAFALVIPNQIQEDRQIALDYLAWIVRELRRRDVEIAVETKTTTEGLVVLLTDVVTDRTAREAESR